MLQEYQLLYLDNDIPINRSFYCNNGDIKSRGLEVHVLDNSQAKDCTGLTLKMIIKVPSGEMFEATVANGLVTVLNAATGIYQILFPNNMGKGRLIAEIQLSNAVPEVIVSRKFSILGDGSLTSDGNISVLPGVGMLYPIIQAEPERVAAENLRKTDEAARKTAEATRAGFYTGFNSSLAVVQNQVDVLVVEGDSSVEAAQARVESDGTINATLKTRLDKKDNINSYLTKFNKSNNPIFLEQFFRTWYGRGQLTAEIPFETQAGTTTFAQTYASGTSVVAVLDASKFLEGAVLAVEYDDGTHDTYFVISKSVNTLTLAPKLRKMVTATTKIQRAWYNSAHANDFALKYIGEQLANTKYDSVVDGEVIQEFNMTEPNLQQYFKKMGAAVFSPQVEASKGTNYGSVLTTVSNAALAIIGYNNGDGYRTIDIPVAPESKINVNLWARANNAANLVSVKTQAGVTLKSLIVPSNTIYEPYCLECEIPSGVTAIYIEFKITATATVGLYIDDIVVSYRVNEGYILPRKGNIVMLFDSWGTWFTNGIEARLNDLLPDSNIINKAVGGNGITDMLARFDVDVAPSNPDVVICDTGINDAGGITDYSTANYIAGYKTLAKKCKEIGAKLIILGVAAYCETSSTLPTFTQWQLTTNTRKMSFDAQKSVLRYSPLKSIPKAIDIPIQSVSLIQNAQTNVCIGIIPNGGLVKVKSSGAYLASANVKLQVGFSGVITDVLIGTANLDNIATTNFYEKTTTAFEQPDFYLKNNSGSNRYLIVRMVNTDAVAQTVSGFVSLEI